MRRALLMLMVAACSQPFQPEPEAARQMPALAIYREWWDETAACVGVTADLARVQFFVVPTDNPDGFPCAQQGRCRALWQAPHAIYLSSLVTAREYVVRHEMVHDLLQGDHAHADPAFTSCVG